MKATFGAEAIGHGDLGVRRELRRLGYYSDLPWVAELTGLDPEWEYTRRFLRPRGDHKNANSRGTRGIWYWWIIESGRVYETKYRTSWRDWNHRLLRVTGAGDIEDMTGDEVQQCLSRDSASTS